MIGTKIDYEDISLYQRCAEWCNKTQQGIIVDIGDGWKVIATAPIDFQTLKRKKLFECGQVFASKRDAIRWINGYGFDCANEDMVNFMAAYTPLLVTGSGSCAYKVWLTEATKGVVELSKADMDVIYSTVRQSQLNAYSWYETKRAEIIFLIIIK